MKRFKGGTENAHLTYSGGTTSLRWDKRRDQARSKSHGALLDPECGPRQGARNAQFFQGSHQGEGKFGFK